MAEELSLQQGNKAEQYQSLIRKRPLNPIPIFNSI